MTLDTLATSTLHILQERKYKNQLMNNSPAFCHSDGMDNISEEILMSRLSQNTRHDTCEISKVKTNSFIEETKFVNNKVKCCWKNCGLYFETLEFLANHLLKVHANSKPCGLYYCEWEGCTRTKGFTARYKMLVHARTHTNEKPHHCYLCSKSFSRAENLKIHKRSHNGEKPYICPVIGCNKAYSNSSDRFKHMKTHQVEKPYVCKIPGCSKRYTDPSSLRKHAKTYKHYSCNQILEQNQVQLVKQESTNIKEIIEDTTTNFCINTRFNSYPTQTYMIQSPELLNFGAFLDYNDTYIRDTYWRKFLEPFTYFKLENKDYLNGYRNIDLPLDLTVNRK